MSNSYQTDENEQQVLLSHNKQQVMMEWEKEYMESCVDILDPKGDVLEIGFGCGYSATQFMKYPIKSYTVIECDSIVIEKATEWAKKYPDIPIKIIEGRWQSCLHSLGVFDEIFFDDFPLDITKDSTPLHALLSMKRFTIFIDLCIQSHTRVGTGITGYLNGTIQPVLSSDSVPFVKTTTKLIDTVIPSTCNYRYTKDPVCLVPLFKVIREYSFEIANQYAQEQIKKHIN